LELLALYPLFVWFCLPIGHNINTNDGIAKLFESATHYVQ
jgi:hypothetical protein